MGDTMASRMDRYREEENASQEVSTRVARNQKKYEDLYASTVYTSFSSVNPDNVIDLSMTNPEEGRREAYQREKNTLNFGASSQPEAKNYEYPVYEKEIKDFDVNHILEEAKKKRGEEAQENKKRLTPAEYNILVDLSDEKVAQYRKAKKTGLTQEEEKNLTELINTITSKTMAEDIAKKMEQESSQKEQDLLDELMPTKLGESIISGKLLDEIHQQIEEEEEGWSEKTSFETREEELTRDDFEEDKTKEQEVGNSSEDSMEFSSTDLTSVVQDEDEDLFEDEEKIPLWIKVIVLLIVLALIGGIIFIVLQNIK